MSVVREIYIIGNVAFIPHPDNVRAGRMRVWLRVHACVMIACSYCAADVAQPCRHPKTKQWSIGTHVVRRKVWLKQTQPDAPRSRLLRIERDLRLGGAGAR